MKSTNKGVYKIINSVNGMFYIGSTVNSFDIRWKQHISDLKAGRHFSPLLQRDWIAYGASAFSFEVYKSLQDDTEIKKEEARLLKHFHKWKKCYNRYATVRKCEVKKTKGPMKSFMLTKVCVQKIRDLQSKGYAFPASSETGVLEQAVKEAWEKEFPGQPLPQQTGEKGKKK